MDVVLADKNAVHTKVYFASSEPSNFGYKFQNRRWLAFCTYHASQKLAVCPEKDMYGDVKSKFSACARGAYMHSTNTTTKMLTGITSRVK